MATYVNDLRLKEIGTGESSGTWGTETNTNLELIGEALGFGTEAITTNADTHTTTVADGSTDPGRAMYLKYTGTLDSACTITIAPNTISRMHFIENATSGSQNIIISQGSGANVTIPAGDVKAVYLDGAGSGAAVTDAFASLNVVDLKVEDDLTVTDDATIGGTLGVTGIVTLTDDLIIGDGKTIGSASDVDAMTIASNGQVTFTQTLIGTALDISGDIDVDGTTNLDVVDIDGAVDMASTLAVGGVVTANAGVVVDNITIDGTEIDLSSGDLTIDVASETIIDSGSSGVLRLKHAGTDYGQFFHDSNNMFIQSNISDGDIIFRGNDGGSAGTVALTLDMSDAGTALFNNKIGIGTTTPSSSVDSHGAKATTAGIPSGIINSTDTTSLAAGNGGAINFSGVYQSGGGKTAYGSIEASKETSTHNEYGAALVFKTREDQGTQNEHMRVTSTGHILLGTTTNQGVGGISFQHNASAGYNIQQNMDSTSGGAELYVFRRNSTQIGSINQSSTNAVTYNTSSDSRLKDVTGSSRGLDVINNLNPVAYNWKADNHADEGLIAQEVEKLVPNAVNQDEDGYYSMDYSKLVTHLVKGMQEQQEQIESLKSEIENLKEK